MSGFKCKYSIRVHVNKNIKNSKDCFPETMSSRHNEIWLITDVRDILQGLMFNLNKHVLMNPFVTLIERYNVTLITSYQDDTKPVFYVKYDWNK